MALRILILGQIPMTRIILRMSLRLRTALLKQCYMGPDVDKIFYTNQDPARPLRPVRQERAVLVGTLLPPPSISASDVELVDNLTKTLL